MNEYFYRMKLNCLLAKVRFFGLLAVFLLSNDLMYGQKDSVSYSVEFGSLYSDDENLPFYLHSNLRGIYNYNFNGPYLRAGVNGTFSFKEYGSLRYGSDLIISNQTDALNLQELYVKYNYSLVSIKADKWELSNSQVDSLSNNKLDANVGLGFVYPSRDFSPFYLQNNRWGEFQNEQPTFVFGELSYQHQFGQRLEMSTGFSFRNNIISSHYVQIDYDFLRLNIGRVKNTFGGLRESLSSGSLGQGNNARPIPQVSLEIKDYIDVPFTNGYFETKGHMSHGWLEEDRYISNALLHSKSFYLKLDLEEEIGWSAASGLVHFAQYGGVSPQGDKQLSSFSDFLRVFAGSGIPISGFGTAGEINALGNHLGIVETTITQKIGEHMLTINYQKPFEDFGSLQYISLTDYLFGLEWDLPKVNSLIDKIYLEYIQTKSQGGPGLPDASEFIQTEEDNFGYKFGGRDDMYNNYLYRSGWTYQGQGIGSPLFLTYERTLNFFDAYPDYGVAIANNRIRAIHLGLSGQINPKMGYDGLFTYTQNFGTYAGLYEGRFAWNGVIDDPNFDYVFRPMREQFYTQIKLKYVDAFNTLPVSFQLRLAYDFGDLYNLFGAEFSISYNLIKG